MRRRFQTIVLAALFAVAFALPAAAQTRQFPEPPKKLPHVHGDPTHNLDFLFGALKVAPDEESAKAIEERIWAVWLASRSDTTNLLMTRVTTAIEKKNLDVAIALLNAIVKIKPNYVEGWNRLATVYYMKKEYGRALTDIWHVLRLEPRHFGALSGLGLILQDIGDDRQALDAYRRALKVYPRMEKIPDLVKTLEEKVEGRDI
jgi:tetratricopeptide (TPR) repeat protein